MNECVLVTGSTGMIGRALCSELRRQGFALRRLLQSGDVDEVESFHWDPLSGFWILEFWKGLVRWCI